MMCSNALNSRERPAVLPMSGSPTVDTGKKQKRGEFKTPPRPTSRRSNDDLSKSIFYRRFVQGYCFLITSCETGSN